jgi:hypothetical protein
MPRYGTIKRLYPRVEVLRGFDPNEPKTFTQAFPVSASGSPSIVVDGAIIPSILIYSGQVISATWNSGDGQYEWQLGWTSGSIPYIALNDSTDRDVLEAGNLVALSCAGKFEIQTPFITGLNGLAGSLGTLTIDVPLTPDGTSGNLKPATGLSGVPIVGYVTRNNGPLSLVGTNSNCTNTNVVSFATNLVPWSGSEDTTL